MKLLKNSPKHIGDTHWTKRPLCKICGRRAKPVKDCGEWGNVFMCVCGLSIIVKSDESR